MTASTTRPAFLLQIDEARRTVAQWPHWMKVATTPVELALPRDTSPSASHRPNAASVNASNPEA